MMCVESLLNQLGIVLVQPALKHLIGDRDRQGLVVRAHEVRRSKPSVEILLTDLTLDETENGFPGIHCGFGNNDRN